MEGLILQGDMGRAHDVYSPTAQISIPTNHVLLISHLGNVYLESINGMQFSPLISVMVLCLWSHDRILVQSEKYCLKLYNASSSYSQSQLNHNNNHDNNTTITITTKTIIIRTTTITTKINNHNQTHNNHNQQQK